jgi:MFS family permease
MCPWSHSQPIKNFLNLETAEVGLGFGAASISPILFGYILDLTNPADALTRYGYFPNWGWAFMILGVGGLMGPLVISRIKK